MNEIGSVFERDPEAAFDSISAGMLFTDSNKTIIHANKAFAVTWDWGHV